MESTMTEPQVINYAHDCPYPHGLWMLEPTTMADSEGAIRISRENNAGTVTARMKIDAPDGAHKDILQTLRRDAYFPARSLTMLDEYKMIIQLRFAPPYYSTPLLYIGKPQIMMREAYRRACQLRDMMYTANESAETPEVFIEHFRNLRLQFAAEI